MTAISDSALERFVRSFSSAVTRVFPGVAGEFLQMARLREEFSELYGIPVGSDFAGTRIAGLFLSRVLAHCASPELARAAAADPLAAERLLGAMSSEDPAGFLWRVFGIRVIPRLKPSSPIGLSQEAESEGVSHEPRFIVCHRNSDERVGGSFVIRRKPRSKAPQPRV